MAPKRTPRKPLEVVEIVFSAGQVCSFWFPINSAKVLKAHKKQSI